MPVNRNAQNSAFGWQFQVDAAIVLALSDLVNIDYVNIEGSDEDIEIYRLGGSVDYVQAKLLAEPNMPARNKKKDYSKLIRAKFQDAIVSLKDSIQNHQSRGCAEGKFMFMTNALYPLGDFNDAQWNSFDALMYDELSGAAREYIDKVMARKGFPNRGKSSFGICVLPYLRPNENDPHCATLKDESQGFLNSITTQYIDYRRYLAYIRSKSNYSAANMHMHMRREDFVWPAIVLRLNFSADEYEAEYPECYDTEEVSRIEAAYSSIIDVTISRFTLTSKVCNAFKEGKPDLPSREEQIKAFAENNVEIIKSELPDAGDDLQGEEFDFLCKFIIIRILKNELSIQKAQKIYSL